jgi:hypothetical protein
MDNTEGYGPSNASSTLARNATLQKNKSRRAPEWLRSSFVN